MLRLHSDRRISGRLRLQPVAHTAHLQTDLEVLHDLMEVREYLRLVIEWYVVEVVEKDERRHAEFLVRRIQHLANRNSRLVQAIHLRPVIPSLDRFLGAFAMLVMATA